MRLTVEFFQENRHFFLGLLVAMGYGGFDALLPSLTRGCKVSQGKMGLAEQFPGCRIFWVEFDATLEMLCRLGVFSQIQIALAQAKA
ncbi:hypothetical protein D3C78_1812530 [compost metagenome]